MNRYILLVWAILSTVSGIIRYTYDKGKKEGLEAQNKSQKAQIDSLTKALENKPTNANTIQIDIDKIKGKKGSQVLIDARQLQALSCDTANIVRWYEGLPRKEKRRF